MKSVLGFPTRKHKVILQYVSFNYSCDKQLHGKVGHGDCSYYLNMKTYKQVN